MMTANDLAQRPLPERIETYHRQNDIGAIGEPLTALLADVFALYVKTKNFHWHMSGPYFRDWHLMLDAQSDELFAMTDAIAERVRKIGRPTLRSIGHIARLQRVKDNDADRVAPVAMLAELLEDNRALAAALKAAHDLCDQYGDVATASLLENWIDEAERRAWFLFETTRTDGGTPAIDGAGRQDTSGPSVQ